MRADSKPKISDLKKLRRRCTLRKNTHERGRRRFSSRAYSLHFEKHRVGGPSGDLMRMLVEKSTESCGSARYRQVGLLIL